MKRYLLTILLSLMLLFPLVSVAQEINTIIKDYPELRACEDPNVACKPGDENFGLPEFIKYLYIFSIGAVGVIGMIAIIIAAFDYTMSAGNPQKAAAGKDKLLSALLGILLLLGSVILLNMINPDLLKLRMSAEPVIVRTVDIEGPPEEGCRALQASWNRGTIDEGENAIFYINLSSECEEIPEGTLIVYWYIHLWQENAAEIQDNRCGDFYRNMTENRIEVSCNFNEVTNALNGGPEIFYMANRSNSVGEIRIGDGIRQYLTDMPSINVIDNQ